MTALVQRANPVEWQELKLQQRGIPAFIRRWRLFVPIALISAFTGIALTLSHIDSPTRDLAIHAIWIFHIITVIRALVAGSTAISREHAGRTWEPLILTGISARNILLGKWLGVLHLLSPWMFGLGVLRLLMLPVLMLAFVNRYAWWSYARSASYYNAAGEMVYREVSWVAWAALLAVAMTLVLTALEIMSSAAVGVAASAIFRRTTLAMIAALCVRFLPVLVFVLVTRQQVGIGPSWRILRATPLAVADGGSAALYQLVLPYTTWTTTAHTSALSGILLSTALLLGLLVVALLAAWVAIRRSGALPRAAQVAYQSL